MCVCVCGRFVASARPAADTLLCPRTLLPPARTHLLSLADSKIFQDFSVVMMVLGILGAARIMVAACRSLFLFTARRYDSARVSAVCARVCLSVCHTPVFYGKGEFFLHTSFHLHCILRKLGYLQIRIFPFGTSSQTPDLKIWPPHADRRKCDINRC